MFPAPYRRILATPGVRAPLIGATIGRLPFAAGALAVVLLVQGSTGSFADAGLVNGAYSVGVAAGMPIQGRLIDRLGQTSVFVVATAISTAAMLVLVLLARGGAAVGAMAGASAIAGFAVPPIGTGIRTLWADLIGDPILRQSAFALDAVALEVAFITGPLLIGLVIAISSPTEAVLLNIALAVAGSVIFASSTASRRWRGGSHDLGLAGPLRSPGVRVLMGAGFGLGLAVGAIELGMTAFAADHGARAAAGGLIAVQAAGSLVSGLVYGSRSWRGSPSGRLAVLGVILTASVIPLVAAPSLLVAFPLMALSGIAFAPTTSVVYLMLDEAAPPGTAAEATGWVLTAVIAGAAIGTALSGAAVGASGPHAGLAVGVAGALVTATVGVLGRRTLNASTGVPAGREQPFARVHSM
jgi:MFS family permease